jgi:hypothetical protein
MAQPGTKHVAEATVACSTARVEYAETCCSDAARSTAVRQKHEQVPSSKCATGMVREMSHGSYKITH